VERPFGYVESSLLNGRSFRSLEHLNETTVWWLAEVADVRVHRQTQARPVDRHAEERPFLLALPAQPYDCSEVVYRSVDAEGFVVYRQNFSSAPWRLIGQVLAVRVSENELTIYDRSFIAMGVHRLFPRGTTGQRSHLKEHEPPRDARQRSEQLTAASQKSCANLPPYVCENVRSLTPEFQPVLPSNRPTARRNAHAACAN
jgi:hypothetical protein